MQLFRKNCLFVLAVLFVAGCSQSGGVKVDIEVVPEVVQRAGTFEMVINAKKKLHDAPLQLEILPAEGLTISELVRYDALTVTFTLEVSDAAPLGERIVKLKAGNSKGETALFVEDAGSTDTSVDSESEVIDTATDSDSDTVVPVDSETSEPGNPTVWLDADYILTGQTKTLVLTGTDTQFSTDSVITFKEGAGLVALNLVYEKGLAANESYITFELEADAGANVGNVIGAVTSPVGEEEEVLYFNIEVQHGPTAFLTSSDGYPGDEIHTTLVGSYTHFSADAPATLVTAASSEGVSFDVTNMYDSTTIAGTITVSEAATPGDYLIVATTQLANGEEETVMASFTVLEPVVDSDSTTDTATDTATDTDTVQTTCEGFTIEPAEVPVGTFSKTVRFKADTGTTWQVASERNIELVGGSKDLFLGNYDQLPTAKCYIGTSSTIGCGLTAGVFATPGTYYVNVTNNGATTCGELTVTADTVDAMDTDYKYLPQYDTYSGTLSDTNVSDFYAFSATAGEFLVFHAVSLNRSTMDPILRFLNSDGTDYLFYIDDEVSMGVDARFAYYFADTTEGYVEVGPKLSYNDGNYNLYVHRVTHGNMTVETSTANDLMLDAQTIDSPLGKVVHGELTTAADVDYYYISTTGPVTVDIAATRISPWENAGADTKLVLYDESGIERDSNSTWYETPITKDPRLFIETAGNYYIEVSAENESPGAYALNVRPQVVINELNNGNNAYDRFVELLGPPSLNLAGWELCTYDETGAPVDATEACVALDDFTTNSKGYLALYETSVVSNALLLPTGAGALALQYLGSVIDKVQYGTVGANAFAEGEPADEATYRAIGRGAGVDTNNNWFDFIFMGDPSPNSPNDRMHPAAVPIYGE